MKITLDLPDDVWRLVEYIPEEMLPSILLDIIRKDIESRSAYVADEAVRMQNSSDIGRLIDMVQALAQNGVKAQVKTEAKETKATEKKQAKPLLQVVSNVSADIELDEDLWDMMR